MGEGAVGAPTFLTKPTRRLVGEIARRVLAGVVKLAGNPGMEKLAPPSKGAQREISNELGEKG